MYIHNTSRYLQIHVESIQRKKNVLNHIDEINVSLFDNCVFDKHFFINFQNFVKNNCYFKDVCLIFQINIYSFNKGDVLISRNTSLYVDIKYINILLKWLTMHSAVCKFQLSMVDNSAQSTKLFLECWSLKRFLKRLADLITFNIQLVKEQSIIKPHPKSVQTFINVII